jgi:hypothetical protein
MYRYILIGVYIILGWSFAGAHVYAQIDIIYTNSILGIDRFALPVCYKVQKEVAICFTAKPPLRCSFNCEELIQFALDIFDTPIEVMPTISIEDIRTQFEVRETYLKILIGIAVRPEHDLHSAAIQAIESIKSHYINWMMAHLNSRRFSESYCAAMMLTGISADDYPLTVMLLNDAKLINKAEDIKSSVHSNSNLRYDLEEEFLSYFQDEFSKAHALILQLERLRKQKFCDKQSLAKLNETIEQAVKGIESSMNGIIVYHEFFTHELKKYTENLKSWTMRRVKNSIDEFRQFLLSEMDEYVKNRRDYIQRLGLSDEEVNQGIIRSGDHISRVADAFNKAHASLNLDQWINNQQHAFEMTNMNR